MSIITQIVTKKGRAEMNWKLVHKYMMEDFRYYDEYLLMAAYKMFKRPERKMAAALLLMACESHERVAQ